MGLFNHPQRCLNWNGLHVRWMQLLPTLGSNDCWNFGWIDIFGTSSSHAACKVSTKLDMKGKVILRTQTRQVFPVRVVVFNNMIFSFLLKICGYFSLKVR